MLLLLADEPTGNLDSESGAQVMQLLAELHQDGTTLCMVTHDPQHANRAQRIVQLADGRIAPASPRELAAPAGRPALGLLSTRS